MSTGNRRVKQVIWFTIGLVLVYTLIFVITDSRKNMETLRLFPWRWLPLILASVMVNFLLRWVKWEWYRQAAGIKVPMGGSFLIYFSGYSMAISPGRGGELIKPFMYKEYFDQKMRRTIPLVFAERLSDLLGMIVLTIASAGAFVGAVALARAGGKTGTGHVAAGAMTIGFIQGFLVATIIFMIALVALARQKRLVYGILIAMSRRKALHRVAHGLRKLYYATYPLLTGKNLLVTTTLAAISWSFECIALMMILHGVGADSVTFLHATFVFCMATIFGGFLFFMPGGAGGFEASAAAMLALLGVAVTQQATSIFLIRFCTLFFSVGIGFLFILLTSVRYHKRMEWEEFEHADEEIEHEAK